MKAFVAESVGDILETWIYIQESDESNRQTTPFTTVENIKDLNRLFLHSP
jgi:hypothetical protein